LHPFGSGQSLNPYANHYSPPFAFSAFSYPLHQQRPLRFACRLAIFREVGGESGLPRSQSCRRNGDLHASVRLAPASPPVALTTTCLYTTKRQPATYLLVRASQQLWLVYSYEGCTAVHIRYACGTCLAPTPHGCWQCRFLPCRHGEPSTEGYVVSEASHPIVTNRARPDRQLLVVQQVTFRQIPNVTRQDKALPSITSPFYVRRTATRVARSQ
jgi:hypothetical protein